MKLLPVVASLALVLSSLTLSAQNQQEPQKTPVEIAALQADKLQKDLGLNDSQTFLIDSVLQSDLTGLYSAFDKMKAGGVQSPQSYQAVQEQWRTKTEEAFAKILSPEQFLKYQKITGSYAKKKRDESKKEKSRKEKKQRSK